MRRRPSFSGSRCPLRYAHHPRKDGVVLMISVTMAWCLMTALPPAPADTLPGAAQDIRKLPPHLVLLVTEGGTITVKKPTGGTMKVRLLGVAAPPTNSPYLRGKYLED